MLPFPRMVQYGNSIVPRRIKKIIGNQDVIYVLYADGDLFVMGSNTFGEYGTGKAATTAKESTWTLSKSGVQDIWTGSGCSALLLFNGVYQYCGLNRILGTTDNVSTMTLTWTNFAAVNNFISANPGLTVKKVQVGGQQIGMLMSNDSLYHMGYDSQGSWGTGAVGNRTAMTLSRTNVSDFVCGSVLNLCQDKTTKHMWRAGWNQYGQLGTNSVSAVQYWTDYGTAVSAMYATAGATMVVDNTGALFGSGEYLFGQLDNNTTTGYRTTYGQITAGLPNATVLLGNKSMVTTVSSYVWWKTISGIYVIGQNLSGEASVGTSANLTSYTLMQLPAGYSPSQVDDICSVAPAGSGAGGGNGTGTGVSYMLSSDDKLWWCGDYTYVQTLTGATSNKTTWQSLPLPK